MMRAGFYYFKMIKISFFVFSSDDEVDETVPSPDNIDDGSSLLIWDEDD